MNLQPIYPRGRGGNMVGLCLACGRRVFANDGYADLDGKAFEAYYCPECGEQRIDAALHRVCKGCPDQKDCPTDPARCWRGKI
jgi:predicted RNA-binding Zn-ribbon protein involved in translation (DUF1610 family)